MCAHTPPHRHTCTCTQTHMHTGLVLIAHGHTPHTHTGPATQGHTPTHARSPSSLGRALRTPPRSGCSLPPGGYGPWTPRRRHFCPPAFPGPGPYKSRQPDHRWTGPGVAASVWPGAGRPREEAGLRGAGGSVGLRQASSRISPPRPPRRGAWGQGQSASGARAKWLSL